MVCQVRRCRKRAGAFAVASSGAEQVNLSGGRSNEQHDRLCVARFQKRGRAITRE